VATYYLFVTRQSEYLVQRNFRLLASIGSQLDNATKGEAKIFAGLATDPAGPATLPEQWKQRYSGPVPAIHTLKNAVGRAVIEKSESGFQLKITVTGTVTEPSQASTSVITLPMARFGEAVMKGKIGADSFDTVLITTASGEIVLGEGRRLAALGPAGLGAVTILGAEGKPTPFGTVAATTAVHEVLVSGSRYKLFVSPCCASLRAGSEGPLVVAGLVETSVFNSDSRAISTTLVKAGAMALLAAFVAWPFLRLTLMGERQRLRRADLFHVGFSSVAGLAILTIIGLDALTYWSLNRDHDVHLERLAWQIQNHASNEVGRAYKQLSCLEEKLTPLLLQSDLDRSTRTASHPEYACGDGPGTWIYPAFESVALVRADGAQQVKLSPMSWVPSRINVGERDYFKATTAGRMTTARLDMCDGGCVLSSLWSWTTGVPQLVLAKRPASPDPPPPYTVATIAVRMASLIDPVVPEGFQYAIVAVDGSVLFHSDHQRNGNENFFQETDDSRRLRAEIHAHSAEPLNLRYWGAGYRAFVKPFDGTPWTIITLYSKDEAWALNREWLIVSFIFLGIYLVCWVVLATITVADGAGWLWPNSTKRTKYMVICAVHGGLILIAAALAASAQRGSLLRFGLLLPLIGWVATAIVLKTRWQDDPCGDREPSIQFGAAATLTLVVCGIVPGVLLFIASFQIHGQSYIKNNELDVARRLQARAVRLVETRSRPAIAPDSLAGQPDLYYDFLYGMAASRPQPSNHAEPQPYARETGTSGGAAAAHREDFILSSLEEYLPYYSETSVKWRELFHDEAGDDSWTSHLEFGGRLALATSYPDGGIELSSRVPSLLASAESEYGAPANTPAPSPTDTAAGNALASAALSPSRLLALSGFGVALLLLAGFAVWILRRHFFLTGVVQPRWAKTRLALNAGDNVFVWCDDRTKQQQVQGAIVMRLGPVAASAHPHQEWRRMLLDMDRNDDSGLAVLVDDFDQDLDNVAAMGLKLKFLEDLAEETTSRAVVVSSLHSARGITDSLRRSEMEGASDRWQTLLRSFVMIDWRGETLAEIAVNDCVDQKSPHAETPAPDPAGRRLSPVAALLESEKHCGDRFVQKVCEAIAASAALDPLLTREQVFDELVDRTAHHYRRIWNSCSDEDRIVLTHVAQDGLVSWSLRGGVRRLLARRLLTKNPELRLMNRSFRNFVLSASCLKSVEVLERSEQPSTWDRLRLPLGFVLVSTGVFLFATQKELYNAILGTTTAAAVSVPTLLRAVGALAGGRLPDAKKDV
ncbi:MAG TPA: hypothetical protein VMZ66_09110, partial [Aeromicrobium sp.]|nr:hypothetical protein [Aeromicrobium sp.]